MAVSDAPALYYSLTNRNVDARHVNSVFFDWWRQEVAKRDAAAKPAPAAAPAK